MPKTQQRIIKEISLRCYEKRLPLWFCMTRLFKIIAITFLFAAAGCNRLDPLAENKDIAKVGDKVLTESDVKSLFTAEMTAEDSARLLESYVDMWVKTQLKVQEAEKMFESGRGDIDKLVDEYRNSLLSHRIDQHYVDMKLDTIYTDEAVAQYYAEHKSDFILDRAIVKGRILRMPDNFRQKKKLKELMSGSGEKYRDFVSTAEKNRLELTEFDTWIDFSDFLSHLPVSRQRSYDDMLAKKEVQELTDGDNVYYVYITESLKQGDIAPQERVEDLIKRVIYNHRKQEVIRWYEDSIYNAALHSEAIEIRLKQ